jgi:hypothetical protein
MSRAYHLPKTLKRRKPGRGTNKVGVRIQLTVSAEEALAIGMDLAYIKAEKDRKIIQPSTYRFLVRAFNEAKVTSLSAYRQGKQMLQTLHESRFES